MKKTRIMVVEDEAVTALSIRNSLEDMGYYVTCICESGEAALKIAAEDPPDLVLTDITLNGDMDGIEMARRIRSYSKIPVVYLTAHSDDSIFQRAKITGPFGYIVKPVDDRELRIAVEIALYKHKMETALRESRRKYRALFKNANDAIYLIDAETQRIIDCNPEAEKISGYTSKQLKSMNIPELHPDKEQDVVAAIFQKINKMGSLSGISGINQERRDGRLVPVEINASKILLDGKKYFMGIFRDITVRKKAEETIKNERNRLLGILDTMKDGVYIVDRKYRVEYINPALRKEFGAAKGNKCHEYFHGRKKACPTCRLREVFAGETVHREWTSSKSGKSFDIIDTPLKNTDGSISKLAILRDITDRKKMEARIKTASITDELTGLLNRRGFFALAEQHLKLALRSGKETSLIYMDLDNLKTINDKLGHRAGDEALVDSAVLLRKTFRKSDIVARIGGDEFAVLLTDGMQSGAKKEIVHHFEENLRENNEKGGRPFLLSFSLGIAVYDPKSPCSLDALMNRADTLMYSNKKEHRTARHTIQPLRDRRKHIRVKTGDEFTVEINGTVSAPLRNLSAGGVCLETSRQLKPGRVVSIRILKEKDEVLASSGRVAWSFTPAGIKKKDLLGLEFIDLKNQAKSSLEHLISDHGIRISEA